MTITARTRAVEDLDIDGDTEIELYTDGKLLATLTVYNPKNGNSYVDYTDELNNIDYNLITIEASGIISNDKPILN